MILRQSIGSQRMPASSSVIVSNPSVSSNWTSLHKALLWARLSMGAHDMSISRLFAIQTHTEERFPGLTLGFWIPVPCILVPSFGWDVEALRCNGQLLERIVPPWSGMKALMGYTHPCTPKWRERRALMKAQVSRRLCRPRDVAFQHQTRKQLHPHQKSKISSRVSVSLRGR